MPPWFTQSSQYRQGHRPREVPKPIDPKILPPLPSMDLASYYDPPLSPASSSTSSASDLPFPDNVPTNSGTKKITSARFARRGKMYAWAPCYDDVKLDYRVRKRMKNCMEFFLPEASEDVGENPPTNIMMAIGKRKRRKIKREEDAQWVLPHLRSPSPPLSTDKLAPALALPQSYIDIMISPATRHSLEDDTVENGLQGTTQELLEGEKGLMQACGRLREILRLRERDVPKPEPKEPLANGDGPNGHVDEDAIKVDEPANATAGPSQPGSRPGSRPGSTVPEHRDRIPPVPQISDTDNLWRVTQELLISQPPPVIKYAATKPGTAAPTTNPNGIPEPVITATPVQRLFTCPEGITLIAEPGPSHPGLAYPKTHPAHPHTVRYNLDMAAQCRAVDDALERVSELLADCEEYKERLEEARDRVADVARARKRVWGVVKERAGWELERR